MSQLNTSVMQAKLADEYLAAARVLMDAGTETSASLPVMFLLAHALELLLKSYVKLIAIGENKKYGHDLNLLWKRAKNLGLLQGVMNARAEVGVVVGCMKTGHEDYQFRYSEKSFSYSGPVMTEDAIRKVRNALWIELNTRQEQQVLDAEKCGKRMVKIPVGIRISIERG